MGLDTITDAIVLPVEILAVILIADFLSGLLHWLEDSYGQPHWAITGRWITRPNILHHHNPRAFTANGYLRSADVMLVVGTLVLLATWLSGTLTWHVALVVALGVNANQFHKWAHVSAAKRPRMVTLMQRLQILQSPRHHARHHVGGKDTHYCVLTNFLNPVLEYVNFWRGLEGLIHLLFGVSKRADLSIKLRPMRHLDGRSA